MILNTAQKQNLLDVANITFQNRHLPEQVRHKLLLNAKLKRIQHEAESARIKNQVDKWLELNEDFINSTELKNLWKSVSTSSCLEFVKIAIHSLALVDGINKSEDVFKYILDMKQVEIDKSNIANLSDKVFSVQVLSLILNNTTLNESEKTLIKSNYIHNKFPIKTNGLADRIANEVQNINQLANTGE